MRGISSNVKSRVKYQNELSSEFEIKCYLGMRQGECFSPFLFSMYSNDIEDEFYLHGINGIGADTIKLFLLLYADDITIFFRNCRRIIREIEFIKLLLQINGNLYGIQIELK